MLRRASAVAEVLGTCSASLGGGCGPPVAADDRPRHGADPRPDVRVLRLVAAGKTNRAIAVDLQLSENTVARHPANVVTKPGLSSRSAATAYAHEHDLVRARLHKTTHLQPQGALGVSPEAPTRAAPRLAVAGVRSGLLLLGERGGAHDEHH